MAELESCEEEAEQSPEMAELESCEEEAEQSPGRAEQGMILFRQQKQRLEEIGAEDTKKRAQSLQILGNVAADPEISPVHKVVFAETLREVGIHAMPSS